ncbi:MAG TPA: hypothetical protein VFG76_05845 [Candidatus Polarisedimenticolia bacterium]|nr:hypothetical protein [Candidatus Polarisedimenticolia bacterium]
MRTRSAQVLASILLLSSPLCIAQSAFDKEIGTDVGALVEKVNFDMNGWGKVHGMSSGRGQTVYLAPLGHPPKRVALVSFYAYDPGNTHGFGSPYFGGRSETTRQLTRDGAGFVATMLHDQGVPALKETFKTYGMELLTPDEFLDTDAKREFFENFEMEMGFGVKLGKAAESNGKENKLNKATRLSAVAPGYRLFRLVYGEDFRPMRQGGDKKISKSLGYDLAKGLGVDATVVICNVCKATKREGSLEEVYLYLLGPNPVPGEESATFWPGHLYVGVRLDHLGIPMLEFGKEVKKSTSYSGSSPNTFRSDSMHEAGIESVDFAGYERILAALGTRAGTYLQEWTTKPKD